MDRTDAQRKTRAGPVSGAPRVEENLESHVSAEQALTSERDLLSAVVRAADAFILVLDRDGHILRTNHAVEAALGFTDGELHGRDFLTSLPIPAAVASLTDGMRRLAEGGDAFGFENHWATASGERVLVSGTLSPLRDPDGELEHVIVTASDVTRRRAIEDELRAATLRDDLTGLNNRRGFAALTDQRLKQSRREGAALVIVFADVDDMKAINDTHGHNAGDLALIVAAQALDATFRESDIVARIGGDEFVVVAAADAHDNDALEKRLTRELEKRSAESGLQFKIAMTLGSTFSKPPHVVSLDELLRQADEFMYERKHRTPHAPG